MSSRPKELSEQPQEFVPHHMMGTTAIHQLGDISRDKPDLCFILKEEEDFFIGHWMTGFGFINVKFPKETTRELDLEERKKYDGTVIVIGNSVLYNLEFK